MGNVRVVVIAVITWASQKTNDSWGAKWTWQQRAYCGKWWFFSPLTCLTCPFINSLVYLYLSLYDIPELQCVLCFSEAVACSSHGAVALRAGLLSLQPEHRCFCGSQFLLGSRNWFCRWDVMGDTGRAISLICANTACYLPRKSCQYLPIVIFTEFGEKK